ncbi:MAG: glycosyltransferase [Planctomycetota bacterium]|nr:glycosyltransferase [Planctomycetota bacterium]
MSRPARIVLTTFGSYGDVLPYLSIGRRLRSSGHEVVLAAPAVYRDLAESAGLEFAPVRPDIDLGDADMFRRVMDPRRGTEVIVREILAPCLRESYHDLESACDQADLLVSHVLTYAAPILGERTGLPWMASVLSPMVFCSAWDPPALAPLPSLAKLRWLGPRVTGFVMGGLKRMARKWSEPMRSFRKELGLNADQDPMWEGQFSPHGNVALFSGAFAEAQPDWPQHTTICGFPFHDEDFGGDPDRDKVEAFLEAGPPPVVCTLGSSGGHAAGPFYEHAAQAVRALDRRAVLVFADAAPPEDVSRDVLAVRSTSFTRLFEASCAVVHMGGIGTMSQALRAGCPQLIVPFSHDQFDNALRVTRLELGGSVSRRRLTVRKIERGLRRILESSSIKDHVEACALRISAEDGAGAACAAIERVIAGHRDS